jgi:hypothetical protein
MPSVERKKLYFDLLVEGTSAGSVAGYSRSVAKQLTPITNTTPGDRYGGLLDALPALVASSPNEIKRRNSVAAWFQCANAGGAVLGACVDFISAVGSATTAAVLTNPIYTRNFRARLKVGFIGVGSVRGTLFVQRQHSIEI